MKKQFLMLALLAATLATRLNGTMPAEKGLQYEDLINQIQLYVFDDKNKEEILKLAKNFTTTSTNKDDEIKSLQYFVAENDSFINDILNDLATGVTATSNTTNSTNTTDTTDSTDTTKNTNALLPAVEKYDLTGKSTLEILTAVVKYSHRIEKELKIEPTDNLSIDPN